MTTSCSLFINNDVFDVNLYKANLKVKIKHLFANILMLTKQGCWHFTSIAEKYIENATEKQEANCRENITRQRKFTQETTTL